jgi:hypothetical protein
MPPSVLYIVWIWQEPHLRGRAGFRATVRAVHEEDSRLFLRASDVARFLARSYRELAVAELGEDGDSPMTGDAR